MMHCVHLLMITFAVLKKRMAFINTSKTTDFVLMLPIEIE